MLKLHDSVLVENPAEWLRLESGVFEVVSPTGDSFRVICDPRRLLQIEGHVYMPELRRTDLRWQITRIS